MDQRRESARISKESCQRVAFRIARAADIAEKILTHEKSGYKRLLCNIMKEALESMRVAVMSASQSGDKKANAEMRQTLKAFQKCQKMVRELWEVVGQPNIKTWLDNIE